MAVDQRFVAQKLMKAEGWFVLFSALTRMPFVACDEETYNDQVFIYMKEDRIREEVKARVELKIPVIAVRVQKKNVPMFLVGLYALGINELVITDGEAVHHLPLASVVRVPDFEKLPEGRRPVLNPQLKISMAYFLQELRRKGVKQDIAKLREMEEEVTADLYRSEFLMPYERVRGEDGKDQIRVLYTAGKDGKKFQPLFTDTVDLTAHIQALKKKPEHQLMKLPFLALRSHLLPEMEGYVLNPAGMGMPLGAQQIDAITSLYQTEEEKKDAGRAAAAKKATAAAAEAAIRAADEAARAAWDTPADPEKGE